jgi:hypothetical protein
VTTFSKLIQRCEVPARVTSFRDLMDNTVNWVAAKKYHQMQVCAHDGADWLPFEPVTIVRTPRGYSAEAVFEVENF